MTLDDAQTTTLTATLAPVTGTSGNIAVKPSTASTLTVSGFPNPTVAGAHGSVTVTADDLYGNVATGYRGTVKFSSSDTKAVLPTNYTFTAVNAGTEIFTNGVTLNTAGTQSITATDTVTGTITGAQGGIAVNKASPTIATTLSASSIPVGGAAHDSSAFTGLVNSTGVGTVTYSYYTNNTCTANAVSVNTVTVPTSGTVPNSNAVTFNNIGTFYWQAVYSGDANNNAVSSPCTATSNEQLTVNKASPTIATSLSSGSISVGQTAYDTSTFTGLVNSTGTGTVAYSYYTNNTCTTGAVAVNTVTVPTSGTVPNSNAVTFNSAGTFYWQAAYSGDANNNAVSSPCTATSNEKLTVVKATPTLTATGPTTGAIGTLITAPNISSVLAGGTTAPAVSGTITFTVFGPQATAPTTCTTGGTTVGTGTTVAGNATYHPTAGFTPTGAGNYWWYASYGGDANNNTATSTCGTAMSETSVAKFSPTVTAGGPATGTAGTAITAANINSVLAGGTTAPAVSGTITFTVFGPQATAPTTCTTGGTTVGTATVTGNATYNPTAGFTPTRAGDYWWYASYGGDANNNTATSTCGSGMTDTVVGKATPTLTATGPTTGTAGTAITAPNISSVLAASSGTTATGTITFTVFGPQATAPTTCTTGGTTVGTGTTVTGNAAYNPTAGFTPTGAGNYWWYASYGGDTNNNAATSTCGTTMSKTTVGKATPTLTATGPTTGTAGTAITAPNISSVLAASSGTTATGTITFTVFGPQATAPTTCTTGGTTVGTGTTVTGNAAYNPTAGFTPTGAGNYWWYASYGGDTNNNAATSTCGTTMSKTTVGKATPTLTATGPTTGAIGTLITAPNISSVLAGGTTAPAVSGTITFTVFGPQATAPTTCTTGGTTVGTGTTVAGNATYHPTAGFTPTGAGNYWWYASYGGDANNNTATSTCGTAMSETSVAKFSPTVTAGGPATGTAGTAITAANINSVLAGGTTAPAVSGTITFTVFGPQATAPTTCTTGGTTVGTATVTGNATYNPTAGFTPTRAGDYWWYASYGGDANNNTATSTCGSGMTDTVVGKATPTLTATGPTTGTAGTAITAPNISSVLAASSGTTATGTITFTVFGPQATAPTTCTTGGTTVGTGTTVTGNAAYNPTAGFTPTGAGNYWWYASYGGDTNNNAATSTCGTTMSKTTVGKATPTLTATGPTTGTAGTAIARAQHLLGPRRIVGHDRNRHHHLHGLRPPGHPPRPPAPPGAPRWGPGPRSPATPPTTRRPASRRQVPATTGGMPPMAAIPTTTRRPRPAARRCPRRRWARPRRR